MSTSVSSRSGGWVHPPDTSATPFVFGAPVPLGDAELEALSAIHAGVGLRLAELWSELLRIEVQVTPRQVEPADRAYIDGFEPAVAHHSLVELVPVPGVAVVTIPGSLALLLVDLLLGGSGRVEASGRLLSAIDGELLANFVSASTDAIAGGYRSSGTERVQLDVAALATDQLDLGERLTSVVVVRFDVVLGDVTAELAVALDRGAAERLVGGGAAVVHEVEGDDSRQQMRETLREVRVQAVVEFPKVMVRSTDLMCLAIGDVMPLSCPAGGLLKLRVGEESMGTVRAARSGTRLACQLVTSRQTAEQPASMHLHDLSVDLAEGAA